MEQPATFEESFLRLQDTIAALEDGGLSLDQAIDQFERAIQEAARCRDLLDKAELRLTKLVETDLLSGAPDDDLLDLDEDED
jgi:exodeoxyribonuclease VII small subunit